MASVIPKDVLEHLREIAEQTKTQPLDGAFTREMVKENMGLTDARARDVLRQLLQEGKIKPQRKGFTDEQAWGMGYLGACTIICYRWTGDEAA